mgnify:CR=1 FL=1
MVISSVSVLRVERSQQLGRRFLPVALRVVLDPAPQIRASILERASRLPLQLLIGQGGIGGQVQDVAVPPADNFIGEIAADNLAEGLDHFEDSAATAGTQVPGADTRLVLSQVVESGQVAVGKVEDVDVITNRSAVARGVV